jgi:transposase
MTKLFVGIDIAKQFHQATIIDEAGTILGGSIRFPNTTKGGEILLHHIDSIRKENVPVVIGLESTGHYWLSLYSFLTGKGYTVIVINPYQSDAWRKVYLSSVKTDKEDAFFIADILRFGAIKVSSVPDEQQIALRNLTRFRTSMSLQLSDTKRRILTVLDQVFPEFAPLFSDLFGKTASAILEEYSTPEALETLSSRKLTNLISKLSRGRFGKEKAKQIQDAAANSFGITFALDSFSIQLKLLLKQMELLTEQINLLDEEIKIRMDSSNQLLTVPGIGHTIAASIMAEIGDIKKFKTSSQLIAFAGINPTVRQSGNFLGNKNKMSKKGSPYLRLALWQAAVIASRRNPVLKVFYEQKLKEGKHKMTAIGAVSRKLTGIIFAILRDNKPFVVQNV